MPGRPRGCRQHGEEARLWPSTELQLLVPEGVAVLSVEALLELDWPFTANLAESCYSSVKIAVRPWPGEASRRPNSRGFVFPRSKAVTFQTCWFLILCCSMEKIAVLFFASSTASCPSWRTNLHLTLSTNSAPPAAALKPWSRTWPRNATAMTKNC